VSAAPIPGVLEIREQFPALRRKHNGHPVAYFDGPGGTQVPRAVVDRMTQYLYHHNANTHWNYPTSAETDRAIADARQSLADFVNGQPDEIAFGANMTTLTFHLARALGRQWSSGDEVVVTELDHHANVAPWHALERERGIRVRMAKMRTEDGTLDVAHLESLLSKKTKLVAVGAASNALGTAPDVSRVATQAKNVGALVFVDAVHYAPHELVDVRALGADFLGCSAYKFYGPHIGVLWGRKSLIEALDAPKLAPAPEESPERLETGTQNHEGIVGAGAAVDYLASLAGTAEPRRQALERVFAELHARGKTLFRQLWNGLGEIDGVRRFGLPADAHRTPTVSFTVRGVPSERVAVALAERGVFVSHGDFYATTIVERLGLADEGLVRIGCSLYTTADEIERALDGVRRIVR
jgi:cysteine desulfurase family protein (TIGR01976 family)